MEDNFLMQLVTKATREGTRLDLVFANREGLVCDVRRRVSRTATYRE